MRIAISISIALLSFLSTWMMVVDIVQKQQPSMVNDINTVKEAHTEELMAIEGVVGVYVGVLDDGTPCIGVMVVNLTQHIRNTIPSIIEGYSVRVEETGEIKPLNEQ